MNVVLADLCCSREEDTILREAKTFMKDQRHPRRLGTLGPEQGGNEEEEGERKR